MGWGSFVHKITKAYHTPAGRAAVDALGGAPTHLLGEKVQGSHAGQAIKHYSLWSNHAAQEEKSAERAKEIKQARTEGGLIKQIRAMYGVAPGDHGEGDAAAASNKAYFDNLIGGQSQAALDAGTHQLDNSFAHALASNAQRLSAGGMAGSSADVAGKRGIFSDFLTGKANLGMATQQAAQTSRNALDDSRLDLEKQVKLGTRPDLNSIDVLGREQLALGEAYRNLPQQALGNLFVQGSDAYHDASIADAYGRRGMPGVTSSGGLRIGGGGGGAAAGTYTVG